MKRKKYKKFQLFRHARRLFLVVYLLSKLSWLTLFIRYFLLRPLFKEEAKYNYLMRQLFHFIGGNAIPGRDFKPMGYNLKVLVEYAHNILNSDKIGKPVVWVDWCFSNEILRAFDVIIFVAESPSVVASFHGTDFSTGIFQEAEKEGIPMELCSGSKGALGSYLLGQSPEPDLIISTSHPCDSTASIYQYISYITKVPSFILDSPYWDDKKSYEYYEKNYWGMIRFLEKQLNQKIDWDRLKQVCETVNTTNYYLAELTEMGRAVPSPMGIMMLLVAWIVKIVAFGSSEGAKSAKLMYENARANLKKNKGYLKEEKIRIIWWDIPLGFYNIHPWLEEEFGAVTVADLIGRVQYTCIDTSSEEKMISGLSRAQLNVSMARHMRGPFEFVTDEFQQIIDEFSGDCVIFSQHVGCTHKYASAKILRDMCREAGLPALFLSTDIFDKRQASEHQIKKEITNFFRSNGLA